ncbi:MAG: FHA domain-containing protein [Kofleriaceae bacterium]
MTRASSDGNPAPAIVLVWSGTEPRALVLPAHAELGRRIAIEGGTHEVADDRMSRDHAVVRWDGGTWVVRDLDSRNGTYLNGERAVGELRRRGDAVLRLGHSVFLLLGDGRGHAGLPGAGEIVGPELARAYAALVLDAAAIFIQGEPGTGKQRAVRHWHDTGPRATGPFVSVSCSSMPEGVAERLLFGGKRTPVGIETIGHYRWPAAARWSSLTSTRSTSSRSAGSDGCSQSQNRMPRASPRRART